MSKRKKKKYAEESKKGTGSKTKCGQRRGERLQDKGWELRTTKAVCW